MDSFKTNRTLVVLDIRKNPLVGMSAFYFFFLKVKRIKVEIPFYLEFIMHAAFPLLENNVIPWECANHSMHKQFHAQLVLGSLAHISDFSENCSIPFILRIY